MGKAWALAIIWLASLTGGLSLPDFSSIKSNLSKWVEHSYQKQSLLEQIIQLPVTSDPNRVLAKFTNLPDNCRDLSRFVDKDDRHLGDARFSLKFEVTGEQETFVLAGLELTDAEGTAGIFLNPMKDFNPLHVWGEGWNHVVLPILDSAYRNVNKIPWKDLNRLVLYRTGPAEVDHSASGSAPVLAMKEFMLEKRYDVPVLTAPEDEAGKLAQKKHIAERIKELSQEAWELNGKKGPSPNAGEESTPHNGDGSGERGGNGRGGGQSGEDIIINGPGVYQVPAHKDNGLTAQGGKGSRNGNNGVDPPSIDTSLPPTYTYGPRPAPKPPAGGYSKNVEIVRGPGQEGLTPNAAGGGDSARHPSVTTASSRH